MKILPISIQNFEKLHRKNAIYVDKTALIHQLVTTGSSYFLSRPRRFGKSLLLSTFKCLFEGKKQLFHGLWIEPHWDWSKKNPVIHLSFASLDYQNMPLGAAISESLTEIAETEGLTLVRKSYKTQFIELIKKIHQKYQQQVVILIDEYDKPIIDYLENTQLTKAKKNQAILKTFYSGLKDLDNSLEFLFITGVSKFSRTSLFSDLNHLKDLTLVNKYATLLGYTQAELEFYFEDYLKQATQQLNLSSEALLSKIKVWYDGYSWDGQRHLYNPFGTLNFLDSGQFKNYWFETATPTFLLEQMKKHEVFEVENVKVDDSVMAKYDLENLELIPLFFQTGYLTIQSLEEDIMILNYPNKEVRDSMYKFLLNRMAPSPMTSSLGVALPDLKGAFERGNLTRVRSIIDTMLAGLPYHTFEKSSEGLYHGLIHIFFNFLGTIMRSEAHGAMGRADVTVETDTDIYLFEFKIKATSKIAFDQIVENDYAGKHRASNKSITGIGVNFDTTKKKCEDWVIERL
jgi:hypothetical protein